MRGSFWRLGAWAMANALLAACAERSSVIAWAMRKAPTGNSTRSESRPMAVTKMAISASISVTPLRGDFMVGTSSGSGLQAARATGFGKAVRVRTTGIRRVKGDEACRGLDREYDRLILRSGG